MTRRHVLIIDNFDSFVFNVPQVMARAHDLTFDMVPNDAVEDRHLCLDRYSHVVISPGPGNPTDPADFGGSSRVIAFYAGRKPLLGICLGHQGIAAHFGARIETARRIMHGKSSRLEVTGDCPMFAGVGAPETMRYHSLVVAPGTLPPMFRVTAVTDDEHREIMAFSAPEQKIFALQFHPESVATPEGPRMLSNFLSIT
ncbi:anthranilate synthase component II [Gemmobacter caeruleus]|uniref:anthranilate synthase component II n=1 Tax=Gemmobacter caeruleus TaxID=2595004 RepID=UPI0013969430|nr:aminodeoxychorismate/anthranilate synthase component II [Gemmobacter caeruleus]